MQKTTTELGWLQGRQAVRKGNGGGQGIAGERKDAWESKLAFAISIILYISQAPQSVIKVPSYRVSFVQGWLLHIQRICNSTKRWLNQTTHFDLVWVPALLFSVTTHFRANTVSPSKGPASSISSNSVWHTAQYKVFSKHMQLSLLATGDVPLTAFSPH